MEIWGQEVPWGVLLWLEREKLNYYTITEKASTVLSHILENCPKLGQGVQIRTWSLYLCTEETWVGAATREGIDLEWTSCPQLRVIPRGRLSPRTYGSECLTPEEEIWAAHHSIHYREEPHIMVKLLHSRLWLLGLSSGSTAFWLNDFSASSLISFMK